MSSQTRDRIESIDAARGTAMLFVCLSHFAWAYLREIDPANRPPQASGR